MTTSTLEDEITGWFAGRLAKDWFVTAPALEIDGDEILVVGRLANPELPADANDTVARAAEAGRIQEWRESTRDRRIGIAREAERHFGRNISWGAQCGETRHLFTTANVPVMTRLRLSERKVLDTLVQSGVARSRSEALGWCVRLVGKHEGDWLADLREALVQVQQVRAEGPTQL